VLSAGSEYLVLEKSASERGTIHVSADFSSTRESSLYFLPQFYRLQFPLTLGKAWTYTIRRFYGPGGVELELEIKRIVQGVVSITVPAGTFDAIRIYGHERIVGASNTDVQNPGNVIGAGPADF